MDALEFLKERKRMCNYYSHCKRFAATVEQWSKEHPRKTRQSVFLEQYPEACIENDGVLRIYPCLISASHRNARGNCATMSRECPDCRREFWIQEVEE